MVVVYGFSVDVESLNSAKAGSFFGVVHYLHNFVHRVEGMASTVRCFAKL